ncbi:MAG: flagellar hook capping FlgD N-terminal domain-containing protein [Acidobacteriaceae bacterium]|nr:flagellar hook capping FlgD N-terminal domain-containing protein [Acidobacteriaceae bacterium]
MATSSILNHQAAMSSLLSSTANSSVKAATDSSSSSSSSSTSSTDSSATITASDFLTLLVTELQNQDPTATNDPNEYVNQLVGVNSLEQLISINQTLTDEYGSTTTTTSSSAQSSSTQSAAANAISSAAGTATSAAQNASRTTSGNLNVPQANAAAQRVASALSSPRS